jgi:hypothetical protein
MVGFLRDVLGLRVEFEEHGTTELSLLNDDRVQVFAPDHPFFGFAGGPIALFEVADLRAAQTELVAAGIELVGDLEHDSSWEWLYFRAPDGNVYGLTSRHSFGVTFS